VGYLSCVSQVFLNLGCHSFAVKLRIGLLIITALLASCGTDQNSSFPLPVTPPDTAPPFDQELAEKELTDENAANTDQHSDDELMEFEPGLGTDEAALRSAFFTGTEDLCAAAFAQLDGSATINSKRVTISWCREIAANLPVPLSAADEAAAHAAGWNDTRAAVFVDRTELCSNTRCISPAKLPYPF
jgi:hypothetical protein